MTGLRYFGPAALSIGRPRLERWLLVAFAATALFLATIGLDGVIAYSVSQRTTSWRRRLADSDDSTAVPARH